MTTAHRLNEIVYNCMMLIIIVTIHHN